MIRNDIINSFLICQYKSYLLFHQHAGKISEYEALKAELLQEYREEFFQALQNQYSGNILEKIPVKTPLHMATEHYVLYPVFKTQAWTISFDVLALVPPSRTPHVVSYLPIEIAAREKVTKTDKLAFTMRCILATRTLHIPIDSGKIVYGHDLKSFKIRLSDYQKEASKRFTTLSKILKNDAPPRIFLSKFCTTCEFYASCRKSLLEKDDLSLLSGMSPKEILKKNDRGIFTTLQLSYTFRPRRKQRKLAPPHRTLWALKALALREDHTYLYAIPKLAPSATEVFIDFEGLPDECFIYLIGVLLKTESTEEFFSFWANTRDEEEHIFTQLFELLSHVHATPIYHYGSYEPHALKRFDRVSHQRYTATIQTLLDTTVNILSFFTSAVYPPTYSNGLKDIATFLGFSWSDNRASGIQSFVWRKRWERSRCHEYKAKLQQYNQEDCHALRVVKEWLSEFQKAESAVQYAKVDDIKIQSAFKLGGETYSDPLIKELIPYSYFDYQQKKIFLRTEPSVKSALKLQKRRWQKLNTVDRKIHHASPFPKFCPICHGTQLSRREKAQRLIIDLKFMKCGIKRQVTMLTVNNVSYGNCGDAID